MQTRHLPKGWQLPASPAHMKHQHCQSVPLRHPHLGPAVPAAGRGWEVDSDSESQRCLGLTQTLEHGGQGILPE